MANEYIAADLAAVRAEIAAAEQSAGRAGLTTLVAAVKYADDEQLETLLAHGVTAVGENRVQQLTARLPLYEKYGTAVHFIGALQTNKVKYIVGRVAMIHSVNTAHLAEEIERQSAKRNVVTDVLIEINSGREPAKSGVMPEEAEALCRAVLNCPHLSLRGFMTMGPVLDSEDAYRALFAFTRELGLSLWQTLGLDGRPLFSMGMSDSFTAAVREGADMVRVGRRLFAT